MGLFGGKHKSLKQLDDQILAARMSLAMYDKLPEENQSIARERVGEALRTASRAAADAGQGAQARQRLDEALKKPPVPEPVDLRWADVIAEAKSAL